MVDIKVGVTYDADLKKTKEVIAKVASQDPARLPQEEMNVFVAQLADSCVLIGVRIWVATDDYWNAMWRMTEEIKYALDENGIEIPYPQMNVTVQEKQLSESHKNK